VDLTGESLASQLLILLLLITLGHLQQYDHLTLSRFSKFPPFQLVSCDSTGLSQFAFLWLTKTSKFSSSVKKKKNAEAYKTHFAI